jgi:GDP-4-dehydro-6-deoxy-D-mannose reductase
MKPLRRVLITGATGNAGWHLSQWAAAQGSQVFGVGLAGAFGPGVQGQHADLTQPGAAESLLAETHPDWIFHLAALIPGSRPISPEAYISTNITGTYYVLEAARRLAPVARVLVASSSSVYGQPSDPDKPITEDAPMQPQSLYAATKATQEMLAVQFFVEHGLHTIRGRTFNQTGPREAPTLVCATLARQVARIEAGLQEPILRAVTLVPRRDFSDVRDVVAAYWAALEFGAAGQAYNICAGRSLSIAEVAATLLSLSTRRDIRVVETGPAPGPRAIYNQIGDAAALKACSAWQPRISLEQSLRDLLAEWRARVAQEEGHA